MNLVLSTDAKPRLKWTSDLHLRFLEAVNHLGGADKATPKSLMRVMAVPGLTLYHLKSHLQKFRLGKTEPSLSQSQSPSQTSIGAKQEDYLEIQSSSPDLGEDITQKNNIPINESFQISQALQVQMEVQRKLHEQIEVQRRLQLRIEAQGKYLQSVLRKAQETLSGYNSSSLGIQLAKAELSRLVSMVNNGCQSSPISELTEIELSSLDEAERKQMTCSVESSLTSSESSGRRENKQSKNETGGIKFSKTASTELPLMYVYPRTDQAEKDINTTHGLPGEQPSAKRSKTTGKLRIFDLNRQYQNDFESNSKAIDLNRNGN
ncbi:Homeodomain-like superfamily protein [Euphorbia peplus]|nr:Homeodomain-like superfamily protein [Euphorbia peplus]